MKVAARKMKRLISIILTVAMVATVLPQSLGGAITVSAAELRDTASVDGPDSEGGGSAGWDVPEEDKDEDAEVAADIEVNTDPDDSTSADSGAEDSSEQKQEDSQQAEGENPDDTDVGEDPSPGDVEEDSDDANAEEDSDAEDEEDLNAEDEDVQDTEEEESSEEIEDVALYEEANEDGLSAAAEGASSDFVSIEVWESGERALVIRCDESEDGNLSTGDIAKAIEDYKDVEPFDVVSIKLYIENGESSPQIQADIFNAAAGVLNSEYEARRIEYGFYNDECVYNWTLVRPNGEMTKSTYDWLLLNLHVNNGRVEFVVDDSVRNIPVETINLYMERPEWRDAVDNNRIREDFFGGREKELVVFDYDYRGNYDVVEDCYAYCGEYGVTIDNLTSLDSDRTCYLMYCEEDPFMVLRGEDESLYLLNTEITPDEVISFDNGVLPVTDWGPGFVGVHGEEFGETYFYIRYNLNGSDYYKLYKVKVLYGGGDYNGRRVEESVEEGSPLWITKLIISDQDIASGMLDTDKILQILGQRAENGERFNQIVIELQTDKEQTIDKRIFNAAAAMLENTSADIYEYDGNLEYRFIGKEDGSYTSWTFGNLWTGEGEGTIDLTDTVVLERAAAGQGMIVRSKRTLDDIPAGWTDVYMEKDEWRSNQGGMFLTAIFGGRNISLKTFLFKDGDIIRAMDGGAYCGDYGISVNVSGLSEGADYLILPCEGDTDNEGVEPISLVIGEKKVLPKAPEGAEWKTLNRYAVTVSDTGEVTAVGGGTAYVIAKYKSGGSDCFKAYKVSVGSADGNYIGRVEEDPESGERTLIVSIFDVSEQKLTKAQVLNALKEYQGEDKPKFDVVRLELSENGFEDESSYRQINSGVVNTAIKVLNQENEDRRIEYGYRSSVFSGSSGYISWTLVRPNEMSRNIDADVTIYDWNNLDNGMIFRLPGKLDDYGKAAERVSLSMSGFDVGKLHNIFGAKPRFLEIFDGQFADTIIRLTSYLTDIDGWYEGNCITVNNVAALPKNSFLVAASEELAPVDVDDRIPISDLGLETDKTWRAVRGTGEVTVSQAELRAKTQGYAYLYPYNSIPAKVYRIWVRPKTATSIRFASEREQIELGWDYEPMYATLKVEFDSDQSVWDVSDSEKIKWATSDPSVVELVDIGGDPEHPKYDGTVMAKKAGEATITVTYIKDTSLSAEDINNILTATCTVKVVDPIKIVEEDWPEVFAITNFDTRLSDVQIPQSSWIHQDKTTEPGTWSWKEPDTALKQFQGQEHFDFAAVYTVADGRTAEYTLTLNLYTLTGISILGFDESEVPPRETAAPVSVVEGNKAALGYRFETDYWDWDGIVDYYKEKCGEHVFDSYLNRIKTEWSIKPAASPGTVVKDGYASGEISYRYIGAKSGEKAEKKTFTVSISDTKTNTVVLKGTHSITVTNYEPVNFDTVDHWPEEGWPENGELYFRIDKNIYNTLTGDKPGQKLTFKSNDTSMLKLITKDVGADPDPDDPDGKMLVSVPYELKKYGIAYVTVTAADELKSSKIFRFEFPDREPKLDTYTITVNKKQEDVSAEITVLTRKDTPLVKSGVGLSGNGSELFELSPIFDTVDTAAGEYITYRYKITAQNGGETLSKKKYSVTLKLPVSWDGGSDASAVLTIKVVNKAPSITIKQTQKVNTFYTQDSGEGYGLLTVSAGNFEVETLTLEECGFTLEPLENDPSQYKITRSGESSGKKGVLSCKVKGYSDSVRKKITIKTASTKPKIVLSSSSDTLYKKLGDTTSTVSLTNKATGEALDIQEAKILGVKIIDDEDKVRRGNYSLDEVSSVAPAKNYFGISLGQGELSFDLEGYVKIKRYKEDGEWYEDEETVYANETATFKFKVWGDGWNTPVTFTYRIKVTNDMPGLKLGSSTLTLNKNSTIWEQQQASTTLRLKGSSRVIAGDIDFGSSEEDENGLDVQYSSESGNIVAKFDTSWENADIKTGTYKYKATMSVEVGEDEEEGTLYKEIKVTLTVKVVDTAPEEGIKVTSKGSIDVLDRDGTSIVYTPKLGNLTGEITDGWLEGTHQSLFESEFANGKLSVRARAGASFVTKYGYKVKARFKVETGESGSYEVVSKELTIKVKQGKPKLTLSADSKLLYRQFNNDIQIDFKALLKKKDVAISDVSLLNYTNDLMLCPNGTVTNDDGTAYDIFYDEDTQSIRLSTQNEGKQILKFGKTWKVKFLIRYRDKAGNVKDAQATYKVIVR